MRAGDLAVYEAELEMWAFIRQGVLSQLIVERAALSSGHLSGRVSCRCS